MQQPCLIQNRPASHFLMAIPVLLPSLIILGTAPNFARAQQSNRTQIPQPNRKSREQLLTTVQWQRVDESVDKGLKFIASRQAADGSFGPGRAAEPGITSLCVMAMLARGHQPGSGPYGRQMEKAIDFVLDFQDPTTGALADTVGRAETTAGPYNHAIAGVMLGEVYGMTSAEQHDRIHAAIPKALEFARQLQLRPKSSIPEEGGWRYLRRVTQNEADLSITVWMLMFLRSAKNAEFDVPEKWIDEGLGYVRRSFDENERGFVYALAGDERYCSRGMVGAGIVSLALGGEHDTPTAREAGDWILRSSFEQYNRSNHFEDRYHYSAFYCAQATFQLGGEYWQQFFPRLLDVLTKNQNADGSWQAEAIRDGSIGNVYTTALTVLTLSTPYQLLPIYQR